MNLEDYIERHIDREPEYLRRLERDTNLQRVNGRMCSGHLQGRLLKMLTRMIRPKDVLELGTFTGYSALCIAEGLPDDGRLTTVELEDELEEPILGAFEESGLGDRIELRIGDALEICSLFAAESFDMIFIDADKREYPEYFREAKRLVRRGGYILADNILWDGHVTEEDRHDRQTEGIREYNRLALEDPEFETVILPVRDGISILRRNDGGASNEKGSGGVI